MLFSTTIDMVLKRANYAGCNGLLLISSILKIPYVINALRLKILQGCP